MKTKTITIKAKDHNIVGCNKKEIIGNITVEIKPKKGAEGELIIEAFIEGKKYESIKKHSYYGARFLKHDLERLEKDLRLEMIETLREQNNPSQYDVLKYLGYK